MAPKESSSRFHPYDTPKKPSSAGKHAKPRANTGLSVNELKRRIRDVKRLLNRGDLPPDARIVQERALAGYEKDLKEETEKRKRSEMIKKYHFVRFLDRKAATKELKRLLRRQKEMTESNDPPAKPEALARMERKIHDAQINVNYTIYYPLTEKYISLYPHDKKKQRRKESAENGGSNGSGGDDKGNADGTSSGDDHNDLLLGHHDNPDEKPPMWHVVESCTAENTLDLLRDGKLDIGADGKPKTATTTTAKTASDNPSNGKTGGASKQQQQQQKEKEKNKNNNKNKGEPDTRQHGLRHKDHDSRYKNTEPMDEDDDDNKSDGGFFEE